MQTSNHPREQLPALTGIRFLLAFHVVLFHCQIAFHGLLPNWMLNILGTGYSAVGVFFVLSGFILAYTYVYPEKQQTIDVRAFWAARFARIYPVYLLALLCLIPFAIFPYDSLRAVRGVFFDPWAGIAHIFTLQTWMPDSVLTWNVPGWSIGNEFFFYLLFPFFAGKMLARLSIRALLVVVVAMWLIGNLAPVLYIILDPDGFGALPAPAYLRPHLRLAGSWLHFVNFNPLFRLPEFVMGVALAGIFIAKKRSGSPGNRGWLAASAAALIVVILATSSVISFPLIHNALLTPLFCLLIFGLTSERGILSRLLRTRAFVLLGSASYSVYILQLPVLFLCFRMTGSSGETMSVRFVIGYVILLLIVSILVYRFVETPGRRFLRRRVIRKRP